jgi:hypothetical protein
MQVAREMTGSNFNIDDGELEEKANAFEREFQTRCLLDMGATVPEARVRQFGTRVHVAPTTLHSPSTADAAAAAAASSSSISSASMPLPTAVPKDDEDTATSDRKHI